MPGTNEQWPPSCAPCLIGQVPVVASFEITRIEEQAFFGFRYRAESVIFARIVTKHDLVPGYVIADECGQFLRGIG